jgi:hypothetical protein
MPGGDPFAGAGGDPFAGAGAGNGSGNPNAGQQPPQNEEGVTDVDFEEVK